MHDGAPPPVLLPGGNRGIEEKEKELCVGIELVFSSMKAHGGPLAKPKFYKSTLERSWNECTPLT